MGDKTRSNCKSEKMRVEKDMGCAHMFITKLLAR